MKVWLVDEGDRDSWISAAYASQELADRHVFLIGGSVSEIEVLDALDPRATEEAYAARMDEQKKQQEREAAWAWRPKSSDDVLGLPEAPETSYDKLSCPIDNGTVIRVDSADGGTVTIPGFIDGKWMKRTIHATPRTPRDEHNG
jgi:hypothetical protein